MQNKIFLILTIFMIIFTGSCAGLDFIPGFAPASTPTKTPTPTQTPTRTPTPTRTITPTAPNTATLISAATFTPFIFVGGNGDGSAIPLTPFTPTPAVPTGGFESIELSSGRLYYGICKENYLKMTVKVEHPEDVQVVYLFYRLETAKASGKTTPWHGTVTDNDGGGYFIYTLRANNIPERHNFIKAWVHYQFVSENAEGEILGRTHIYTRNITLEPCK